MFTLKQTLNYLYGYTLVLGACQAVLLCPDFENFVCSTRGITYKNICFLTSLGEDFMYYGPCQYPDEQRTTSYEDADLDQQDIAEADIDDYSSAGLGSYAYDSATLASEGAGVSQKPEVEKNEVFSSLNQDLIKLTNLPLRDMTLSQSDDDSLGEDRQSDSTTIEEDDSLNNFDIQSHQADSFTPAHLSDILSDEPEADPFVNQGLLSRLTGLLYKTVWGEDSDAQKPCEKDTVHNYDGRKLEVVNKLLTTSDDPKGTGNLIPIDIKTPIVNLTTPTSKDTKTSKWKQQHRFVPLAQLIEQGASLNAASFKAESSDQPIINSSTERLYTDAKQNYSAIQPAVQYGASVGKMQKEIVKDPSNSINSPMKTENRAIISNAVSRGKIELYDDLLTRPEDNIQASDGVADSPKGQEPTETVRLRAGRNLKIDESKSFY